jgi:hypothetical protein
MIRDTLLLFLLEKRHLSHPPMVLHLLLHRLTHLLPLPLNPFRSQHNKQVERLPLKNGPLIGTR